MLAGPLPHDGGITENVVGPVVLAFELYLFVRWESAETHGLVSSAFCF